MASPLRTAQPFDGAIRVRADSVADTSRRRRYRLAGAVGAVGALASSAVIAQAQAPASPPRQPSPPPIVPTPAPAIALHPPHPQSALSMRREVVARGLRHPWSMVFLPNGDFLVTEKDGTIQRVSPAGRVSPIGG